MLAAAWWAGSEPSETMPDRGTDSSRASVSPAASLCNRAHSSPSHYHSILRKGWRGGPRKVFPTTSPRHFSVNLGKKSWLRCEGDVLNRRKRSSNLTLCGSIKRSAGQLRFSLATARVITSTKLLILGRKRGGDFPSVPYVNFLRRRQEKRCGRCPRGSIRLAGFQSLGAVIGSDRWWWR